MKFTIIQSTFMAILVSFTDNVDARPASATNQPVQLGLLGRTAQTFAASTLGAAAALGVAKAITRHLRTEEEEAAMPSALKMGASFGVGSGLVHIAREPLARVFAKANDKDKINDGDSKSTKARKNKKNYAKRDSVGPMSAALDASISSGILAILTGEAPKTTVRTASVVAGGAAIAATPVRYLSEKIVEAVQQ